MRSRASAIVGGTASSSTTSTMIQSDENGAVLVSSSSLPPPSSSSSSSSKEDSKMLLPISRILRNAQRQRNLLAIVCIAQTTLICILLFSGDSDSNTNGFLSTIPALSSSLRSINHNNNNNNSNNNNCQIELGTYHGPIYNSVESGTIGQPQCLLRSKWMQVSMHTVQFPGSTTVMNDWLWIDYHDRINVVVENVRRKRDNGDDDDKEEREFLVFEQTKYALEGRTSLAIIGGIIEPGEDPEHAAHREVTEEMNGLVCNQMHFLGRYRTDVNRGMGWLHSFLATDCVRPDGGKDDQHLSNENEEEQVGAADTERQRLMSITLTELRQAARDGRFLEVQWTTTLAQALLHPELASS